MGQELVLEPQQSTPDEAWYNAIEAQINCVSGDPCAICGEYEDENNSLIYSEAAGQWICKSCKTVFKSLT
jgi:hypothetical protein